MKINPLYYEAQISRHLKNQKCFQCSKSIKEGYLIDIALPSSLIHSAYLCKECMESYLEGESEVETNAEQ